MMRLIGQMMKLPLAVFVYGMEMLAKTMQDMQKMADQGIDLLVSGAAPVRESGRLDVPGSGGSEDSTSGGDRAVKLTTYEEESKMPDQDLSGDDLKYVSYSISFTKPHLEVTLEKRDEQVVNYSTNGASYGAIEISHFWGRVARGQVKRPQLWADNNYPEDAIDDYNWALPLDDEKYIRFDFHVERRTPKQDPEYPREQVKVLKQIRDRL
jgi:hypothetical protein